MTKKTQADWQNEAADFIYNWGSVPEYSDVKKCCHDLAADTEIGLAMMLECGSIDLYAETLWCYIRKQVIA